MFQRYRRPLSLKINSNGTKELSVISDTKSLLAFWLEMKCTSEVSLLSVAVHCVWGSNLFSVQCTVPSQFLFAWCVVHNAWQSGGNSTEMCVIRHLECFCILFFCISLLRLTLICWGFSSQFFICDKNWTVHLTLVMCLQPPSMLLFVFVLCRNALTACLCKFTERTLPWHWHQLVPSLSQHHYLVPWLSTSSKHTSWRPTRYLKMWKGIIFRQFACILWLKACWPNLYIVIMIMMIKMMMVLLLIITFTAAKWVDYMCVCKIWCFTSSDSVNVLFSLQLVKSRYLIPLWLWRWQSSKLVWMDRAQ